MSPQREIIEIPARSAPSQDDSQRKLRVAAYCRVSTSQEAQLNSYQAQRTYYLEKIAANPEWVLVDIFADEGITGTSVYKRTEFQRMIRWCKRGKIDLILTKSISRFARNTVDCLHYVRVLKNLGIPVIFETERLNTSQMDSEFLLAMLGANSQAESEAASSRIKWGVRAAFREGKVSYQYKRWLGYRRGADGRPEIVPEEARVVKQIYEAFLAGHSLWDIKAMLEQEGIPTKTGLTSWSHAVIQNILQNEKYTGDVLLQKTYTTDPITKQRRKNRGDLPQYLVKNCHPAIISRDMFELVQTEFARRTKAKISFPPQEPQAERKEIYSSKYALSGILQCGECGAPYRRCTWRRNSKTRIVWRCQNRLQNGTRDCKNSPTIDEPALHRALVSAINRMLVQPEYLRSPFVQGEMVNLGERIQNIAASRQQVDDAIISAIIQYADCQAWDGNTERFRDLLRKRAKLTDDEFDEHPMIPDHLEEYNDDIARQVFHGITILEHGNLNVKFKNGWTLKEKV